MWLFDSYYLRGHSVPGTVLSPGNSVVRETESSAAGKGGPSYWGETDKSQEQTGPFQAGKELRKAKVLDGDGDVESLLWEETVIEIWMLGRRPGVRNFQAACMCQTKFHLWS